MTPVQPVCPECDSAITVPEDLVVSEIVACDACGAELEVTAVEPVALGPAPEIEEDWGE